MARGFDGMLLFKDNYYKQQMIDYLSKYLPLTECRCYAWALLDNHYHLLLRTGQYRLGETMLRVHSKITSGVNMPLDFVDLIERYMSKLCFDRNSSVILRIS